MVRLHPSFRFAALSWFVLSTLAFGVIVSACGSELESPIEGPDARADVDVPDNRASFDADVPDATDAQTDSGPSCDAALVLCGSTCVDTQSAPSHCGTCGHACSANEACRSGECKPVCRIEGSVVDAGAIDPANACLSCEPALANDQWSPRPDGTACATGKVCASGTCDSQCFIGGSLRAPDAVNPDDACEQCLPATSTTTWTSRASFTLLAGGTDVAAQGWSTAKQSPSTLTYGPDYVRLATATVPAAKTSGQLLLYRPGAVEAGKPFKIQVLMLVESVNAHNAFDSAAAIMGSFTPPSGGNAQRSEMIYLDSAAIGWADDSQTAAFSVQDGVYHTYELSVDAAHVANVSVDGTAKLTRNSFVFNGTIAIGDQTNDLNVDSAVRIRSVTRVCP